MSGFTDFMFGKEVGKYGEDFDSLRTRAAQAQTWQDQSGLAQALKNRSLGLGGPSIAEQQMRAGMGSAVGGFQSVLAGQPGMSPGMAARLGAGMYAKQSGDLNQQTGMLRAQEQLQAQQLYAQQLQAMYNQKLQNEQMDRGTWAQSEQMRLSQGGGFANQLVGAGLGTLGSMAGNSMLPQTKKG